MYILRSGGNLGESEVAAVNAAVSQSLGSM